MSEPAPRFSYSAAHIVGFVAAAFTAGGLTDVIHLVATGPHSLVTFNIVRPWGTVLSLQLVAGLTVGAAYTYFVKGSTRAYIWPLFGSFALAALAWWFVRRPSLIEHVVPGLWVK